MSRVLSKVTGQHLLLRQTGCNSENGLVPEITARQCKITSTECPFYKARYKSTIDAYFKSSWKLIRRRFHGAERKVSANSADERRKSTPHP
ncbi:hypothetical protein M378DRAFT_541856 [Amanita muscaria Koide BX008]|uniref:Uncharacterized protein n=1 Tax=Amanita muscaria (strain Koide BX008) TaxID=946122 RepID=A0A0C2TE38_AMAMK|nr:hypothetical protein M378DRAFT_541856 [Amanita muscaria Koide BX008]